MKNLLNKTRPMSVGAKLSAITFMLVALVFAFFLWAIGYSTSKAIERHSVEALTGETQAVVNMIELFDSDLQREADRLMHMLAGYFPDPFTVDAAQTIEVAGRATPTMKNGKEVVNLNFSAVDRFTRHSGEPYSVANSPCS